MSLKRGCQRYSDRECHPFQPITSWYNNTHYQTFCTGCFSETTWCLKMKEQYSFKTLWTTHPAYYCHIPDDLKPHTKYFRNPNVRTEQYCKQYNSKRWLSHTSNGRNIRASFVEDAEIFPFSTTSRWHVEPVLSPIQWVPGTRWLECVLYQAQGLLYLTLHLYMSNNQETKWSGNTACVLEALSSNLSWYSDYPKQGFCGFSHFLWTKKVKAKLSLFKSCGHTTGPEVQLHSLPLALDGNEWSIWCSSCLTASKITSRYPMNKTRDILGKKKISGPCKEQNPRVAQPAQQSQYRLCYSLSGKCQDGVGMDILFDCCGSNHISLCIYSILYTNVQRYYSEQCCLVTVSSY
jgi:hypothetical protein